MLGNHCNVTGLLRRLQVNIQVFKIIKWNKHGDVFKNWLCPNFLPKKSLPKKSELPKFWGDCSPPRPPGPYAYAYIVRIFCLISTTLHSLVKLLKQTLWISTEHITSVICVNLNQIYRIFSEKVSLENSELFKECMGLLGSLSGNVFERRTSTASERFSFSYMLTLPKLYYKCLLSYRDDLPKNMLKITAQEYKNFTSGWHALLKNVVALTPF